MDLIHQPRPRPQPHPPSLRSLAVLSLVLVTVVLAYFVLDSTLAAPEAALLLRERVSHHLHTSILRLVHAQPSTEQRVGLHEAYGHTWKYLFPRPPASWWSSCILLVGLVLGACLVWLSSFLAATLLLTISPASQAQPVDYRPSAARLLVLAASALAAPHIVQHGVWMHLNKLLGSLDGAAYYSKCINELGASASDRVRLCHLLAGAVTSTLGKLGGENIGSAAYAQAVQGSKSQYKPHLFILYILIILVEISRQGFRRRRLAANARTPPPVRHVTDGAAAMAAIPDEVRFEEIREE
ncbi:hypothetical protein JCM9279_003812 [Rhodotorula babjevae]